MPSNVNALIPAGAAEDPSTLSVNYTALDNPSNNAEFTISVGDGDADYNTKTYYFKVNKLNPLTAQLATLSVSAGTYNSGALAVGTLVHNITIPATETSNTATLAWTKGADIQSVDYAVDSGGWTAAPASIPLSGLAQGTTKLIRIKVRTTDGGEAQYLVTITHAANTANTLTGLSVTKNDTTTAIALSPGVSLATVYYYTADVSSDTTHVKVTPTAPTGGKVYISRNGGAYNEQSATFRVPETGSLAAGASQIINIQVRPQEAGAEWVTYTLIVRRSINGLTALNAGADSVFSETFTPSLMSYTLFVPSGVSSPSFTPTINTSVADLYVKKNTGVYNPHTSGTAIVGLVDGDVIRLAVEPKDATAPNQIYTINVGLIAYGGTVTFVNNGNGTYDEVHSFTFENASSIPGYISTSSNQAAFNFTIGIPISDAKILVVGGGGGGAKSGSYDGSGGGGAGGLIFQEHISLSAGNKAIFVGGGGSGSTSTVRGGNGSNSSFDSAIAYGGGGGGCYTGDGAILAGLAGGSSGGGAAGPSNQSGISPAPLESGSQGNIGGAAINGGTGNDGGGGGGGAGGAGGDGTPTVLGVGGDGLAYDISGATVTYSSGGNGGSANNNARNTSTRNYGDGGDAGKLNAAGQAGNSGIVIVRFPYTP
jgi:hypothetical protein